MESYEVSIVLTTRNEARHIGSCLESIKKLNYPQDKIEIIVVDNSSVDNTKEIALRYTDKVYNFSPERSAQRNFGVRQAQGKYILYLDADMLLSERILQECVEKCEKEDCLALYIPERIIGRGYWVKVRDFERSFYNSTCIDAARFIRKNVFSKIGGFDESLTGPEDWDFDRRIRVAGKVCAVDSVIYHQEGDFNLSRYLNKKGYYAQTLDKYIQKWGRQDEIIKKQLGLWYRFFGVFLENGKWKKLLRHPALSLGMYFLRVNVGFRFITNKDNRKSKKPPGILILSPFFWPNLGGVETHLNDLCEYLKLRGYRVTVLTYQPLTIRARGKRIERKTNLAIHRICWPGFDLFHKLENHPVLEVLYITPRLLWTTFWFLLFNGHRIQAIHAHGLNAALIVKITNIFFKKKTTLSIHAIYNLRKRPCIAKFIRWIATGIDSIMPLAEKSKLDFVSIGIPKDKIQIYTQWVDQNLFIPRDKTECRKILKLEGEFIALFVGRLLDKKGLQVLLDVAKRLPYITFVFAGDGPMFQKIKESQMSNKNVYAVGRKDQQETAIYYSAADVVVVPSQYEEGFARVVLEALSCGRPLIAANNGCLPEMITEEVGLLLNPDVQNITQALNNLYHNSDKLKRLSENARPYALKHFSSKNAKTIEDTYRN